jgi:hypothetical protein
MNQITRWRLSQPPPTSRIHVRQNDVSTRYNIVSYSIGLNFVYLMWFIYFDVFKFLHLDYFILFTL